MVAVPLVVVIASSLVVTIACTVTLILRTSSSLNSPLDAWGSKDLFSKDSNIPTPSSATLIVSSNGFFSPPDASTFQLPPSTANASSSFTAATLLAYILSGYNLLNSTSSFQFISDMNSQLSQNVTKVGSSNTVWPNLINASLAFSDSLELAVVSANASSSSSSKSIEKDQIVTFVERSLGLDFSPVVMLFGTNGEAECVWVIALGFNGNSFLILNPTSTTTSSGKVFLQPAQWVERDQVYSSWNCSGSRLVRLAMTFRKRK
jgi:hypothetical protein